MSIILASHACLSIAGLSIGGYNPHKAVDWKKSKRMLKTIREYAHVHSQLPPSRYLRMECNRKQMRAPGKATNAARVD